MNLKMGLANEKESYSVRHNGIAFCGQMSPVFAFLSENDQLFYFQDLINRGYSINQRAGGMVELDYCRYGYKNQTDLQRKFADILVKAGADTTLVRWTYSK